MFEVVQYVTAIQLCSWQGSKYPISEIHTYMSNGVFLKLSFIQQFK